MYWIEFHNKVTKTVPLSSIELAGPFLPWVRKTSGPDFAVAEGNHAPEIPACSSGTEFESVLKYLYAAIFIGMEKLIYGKY